MLDDEEKEKDINNNKERGVVGTSKKGNTVYITAWMKSLIGQSFYDEEENNQTYYIAMVDYHKYNNHYIPVFICIPYQNNKDLNNIKKEINRKKFVFNESHVWDTQYVKLQIEKLKK
mmetsp:Transcript_27025/g.27268  ORF Transcript_27025/g.27268 Transcript_27025/m.27268 type:complete len:117 (-) Transcript_27025:66-416(-)